MRCTQCSKIVRDSMNFCPFCGMRINEEIVYKDQSRRIHDVEQLLQKKDYHKLLKMALNGSQIAKNEYYYYLVNNTRMIKYIKDSDADIQYLYSQINEGNIDAKAFLGIYLYLGACAGDINNNEKIHKGVVLINDSAEQGNEVACTFVGIQMLEGKSYFFPKDERQAYIYLKSASDKQYPLAMYWVGSFHYEGKNGVTHDEKEGYKLIQKAALLGDKRAKNFLISIDKHWFDTDIECLISKKDREAVKDYFKKKELAIYPRIYWEKIFQESDNEKELLSECVTLDEYCTYYNHQIVQENIEDLKYSQLQWMNDVIRGMGQGDKAPKITYELKRVRKIMHNCAELKDFLLIRDTIKKENIKVNSEIDQEILEYCTKKIVDSYPETLEDHRKYKEALNENIRYENIFQNGITLLLIAAAFFMGTLSYPSLRILGRLVAGLLTVPAVVLITKGKIQSTHIKNYMNKFTDAYEKIEDLIKKGIVSI